MTKSMFFYIHHFKNTWSALNRHWKMMYKELADDIKRKMQKENYHWQRVCTNVICKDKKDL